MNKPLLKNLSLSLLAGSLLALAFAPLKFALFAHLSPAVLWYLLQKTSPKRAFFSGWVFGVGLFGVGLSWIVISLQQFGDLPQWGAILATLAFVATMAIFYGAMSALYVALLKRTRTPYPLLTAVLSTLLFAALWSMFEWTRAHLWVGLPWLLLSDSQVGTPFAGFLPIVGIWGTSFLVALSAAILGNAAYKRSWLATGPFILLVILAAHLKLIHYTQPNHKTLRVAAIQANIEHRLKWDPTLAAEHLQQYEKTTNKILNNGATDLIIWPENAIPLTQNVVEPFLTRLENKAKQKHSHLLVGLPAKVKSDPQHFVNRLLLLGNTRNHYDKRHLLPLGEFTPFENLLKPWMEAFGIPTSDYIAGHSAPTLHIKQLTVLPFICYDIAFTQRLKTFAQKTDLFITTSDDSWFGHSFAPAQHLQVAQARSLLSGKPMLFVTNTGFTASINAMGQITKQLPTFSQGILQTQVRGYNGATPWNKWGDWPWAALVLLIMCTLCRRPST